MLFAPMAVSLTALTVRPGLVPGSKPAGKSSLSLYFSRVPARRWEKMQCCMQAIVFTDLSRAPAPLKPRNRLPK
jgi:hypothetical protein